MMHTAHHIHGAFLATDRDITPARAADLARAIQAVGGDLDAAIMAAQYAEQRDEVRDLLTYRAALKELASPGLRIDRLRREAADEDRAMERSRAGAEEYEERADLRAARGDHEMADTFRLRAKAYAEQGDAHMARAISLRLRAAEIEAGLQMSASAIEASLAAMNTGRVHFLGMGR